MSDVEVPKSMSHFLKLAWRGVPGTGASSGECSARRLALAIVENASGLDDEALAGAADFLVFALVKPWAARDLIESVTEAARAREKLLPGRP